MGEMENPLRWSLVKIFIYGLLVAGLFAEEGEECHPAKTCGKCMTIHPMCSWCKDEGAVFPGPRCDLSANLERNRCINVTYEESNLTITMDMDLQEPAYSLDDEMIEPAIPIAPQHVDLNLRLGDKKTIDVRVLQVKDYPLDLYYLMDMSVSMDDDLENLKILGTDLAEEMKRITRSLALGFGLFVDKPVSPYISIAPDKIDSPCYGCQKTFSFRNRLSLNKNTSLFKEKVNSTQISGNQDIAEGTLDAIMQVAVCKKEIGWRENTRKLLLITSDGPFHVEGDGKLAGILRPNDGNCHLTEDEYADAHLYDYPSLGHLNEKLIYNNIIPIFAISDFGDLYEGVAQLLQGATYSELSSDSSNILQILASKYEEITGTIELAHSAVDGVELRISSECREGSDPVQPGDRPICTNVRHRDEILFQVEVKATRCVDQTFDIYPIGLDKRLTVHVKVACNCSCDFERQLNSTYCSDGSGDQVCGICQCKPGRYGDTCECTGDGEENQDQSQKDIFCKPDNVTKLLCSGKGECICGQCRCHQPSGKRQHEVVSGTYCECNNQDCPRDDGEVCGGSERGECVCAADGRTNECRCRPGYTGENCNCPTQTDTCRSSNGLLCNAAGNCVCGKCECGKGSKFSGPRCDKCLTCRDCDLHIGCVQCRLFNNTQHLSAKECDMCSQIIKNVTELPEGNVTESMCNFSDGYNCSIRFVYEKASNGTTIIYVKGDKDCAYSEKIVKGVQLHILIICIVSGIIVIGLILILMYRLYIWHLDQVEYKHFLEEKQKANWSQKTNPLYKKSEQKFINPMYGK
ncbi:Integrin beta-3 [Holothuria leucospilota]|uniref:Integrin beta n=1 Tax=Holothuria leucospilota TaxID=206669 RepID=A0A9Q0YM27_HOLLE|nr:Integrin beta-3 [Holothuria leucospilota]